MSVVYPTLPSASLVPAQSALVPLERSVVGKPKVPRHEESPFEEFYRTYCTELRDADLKREAYKKEHKEWKNVFDDEFPHPEKGLLAMSTGDSNGHVRVRRLRDIARLIKTVKSKDDQQYITLIEEINAVLKDEENEFPLPQPVVDEVIAYANDQGELTENYYEQENDEWVLTKGPPDFKKDLRSDAGDNPYADHSPPAVSEVPTFLASIYKAERPTQLFKSMLENPLDKTIADAYESEVNGEVVRKAKEMKFEGSVKLPLSHFRGIVMAGANMHSLKEGMEAKARQGEDVRMGEIDLESMQSMYSNVLSRGKSLLESLGCPPTWTNQLDATVIKLSEDHRKTKQGSIFTDKQLADVHSQHGGSWNESAHTDLSKEMQDAEAVFTHAMSDPTMPENLSRKEKEEFLAAKKQHSAGKKAASKSGSTMKTSGIEKLAGGKRKTPKSLPTSGVQRLIKPGSAMGPTQADEGHEPSVNAAMSDDVEMGDGGADSRTSTVDPDGPLNSDGPVDPHMTAIGNDQLTGGGNVGSQPDTGEPVLPSDMTWYRSKWDDATPLLQQILHKPRDAHGDPGTRLVTMNAEIRSRVAHDQEQISCSDDPVSINVELEVPVVDFVRVMVLCTEALVASGRTKATEIQDPAAKTARDSLVSRLNRAEQPWRDEVDKLIECKADAWKAHAVAGTAPANDELLWDEEFKKLVLEYNENSEQLATGDVFANPGDQSGKIGGFRVASRKRDGTEIYQVLVQKGTYTYKDSQTSFWHIRPASMYRAELVEEYKANRGTEITSSDMSSDDGKKELARLKQYDLASVKISGIAVIPRTEGTGLSRMPTMFIEASVDYSAGPRFWSRSYMNKVWGPAATRAIRDVINAASIPVLSNDAKQPWLFMPQNASKRTCTLWGVEYTGAVKANERGEDITRDKDGELEPNDGIYESDNGFVEPDAEQPIDPSSKEFVRADKMRKMEELKVRLAELERTLNDEK